MIDRRNFLKVAGRAGATPALFLPVELGIGSGYLHGAEKKRTFPGSKPGSRLKKYLERYDC